MASSCSSVLHAVASMHLARLPDLPLRCAAPLQPAAGPSTPVVDRGIALHKMIRLLTMALVRPAAVHLSRNANRLLSG